MTRIQFNIVNIVYAIAAILFTNMHHPSTTLEGIFLVVFNYAFLWFTYYVISTLLISLQTKLLKRKMRDKEDNDHWPKMEGY